MLRHLLPALAITAVTAAASPAAPAAPAGFTSQIMVNFVNGPVSLAFLPDGRLFIAEQIDHQVRLWTGGGFPSTVINVPNVRAGGEGGLLGIAPDPRWPLKPYLYLLHNYIAAGDTDIRIVRFTCEGDLDNSGSGLVTADPASRRHVLTGNRDQNLFHNGGTLRFGPDGMLYASFGEDLDGCASQDTTNLNGKILRLDVSLVPDGPGAAPPRETLAAPGNPFVTSPVTNHRLVYALGLRNPFRFHLDALTGDAFVADVGHDRYEEIDFIPAGGAGGLDFGWPWREGFASFSGCASGAPSGFTDPIWVYDHDAGSAVISAGLYRRHGGPAQFPADYEGDYFFADYYTGSVYRLRRSGASWSLAPPAPGQPDAVAWGTGFRFCADWMVAPDGSLWWCDQSAGGRVHRLAWTGVAAVDPGPVLEPAAGGGFYDLQGRRVENPQQNGLYFTRTGAKRVVLR